MLSRDVAAEGFVRQFSHTPDLVVNVPGRVNLIGEHTDYHEGFVMPFAINRGIQAAIRKRTDGKMIAYSKAMLEEVNLTKLERQHRWCDLVIGVVFLLKQGGFNFGGFSLYLHGDLPRDIGLASSAALEVATGFALQQLFGISLPPERLARLAQRAEIEFGDKNCGIMDQFNALLSKWNRAMMLDCRSLSYELLPFDLTGQEIIVTNSMVSHRATTQSYNQRRLECDQAIEILRQSAPGVATLRDVDSELLEACSAKLSEIERRRVSHVVSENSRVLRARTALKDQDFGTLGRLINESHDSLRDNYEVSCEEIDRIVQISRGVPGVLGSRILGAGFGGCCLSLVNTGAVEQLEQTLSREYRKAYGVHPISYRVRSSDGATLLT